MSILFVGADEALHLSLLHGIAITEDDYFAKSAEFRLWLRQAKKKYFEDLSADEARRYFRKFVRAWNDFDLDGMDRRFLFFMPNHYKRLTL